MGVGEAAGEPRQPSETAVVFGQIAQVSRIGDSLAQQVAIAPRVPYAGEGVARKSADGI